MSIFNFLGKDNKKEAYSKYLEFMPDFKQEKTRKITTISLTLASSILLGLFAINPTLSTIAGLQRQLQDDKYVEQKLQEKIQNLAILEQKYAEIKPDLDFVYNAVPKDPQVILLVGQIQALAKNSNLALKDFQISEVGITTDIITSNKSSYFAFNFAAEGKYEDMINFMSTISKAQRIITIDESSITKSSESDNAALTLNIKGNTYFKQ